MTNKHPYDQLIEEMKQADIVFERGLTEQELISIGTLGGFTFPPDLAEFLIRGVPIAQKGVEEDGTEYIEAHGFYNWHDSPYDILIEFQQYLLHGIIIDLQHNNLWKREWGERPSSLLDAIKIASWQVANAPKMIPLYRHRCLPATPCLAGNPVFSIVQTDIIYYGCNLEDYWRNEFLRSFEEREASRQQKEYRDIDFWSDL